jgi:hypothetical protein
VTSLRKVLQATSQLDQSSPPVSSEIHPKNIIMVTLEEVPEDTRKVFASHRKAIEKHREMNKARELQEFLTCFKKD